MIQVNRSRYIQAAPEAVFAALAEPDNLAAIMPRVRKVEMLERNAESAKIVTYMALGPFGDIRSEGDVHWRTNHELIFKTARPVPVEARWTLTAVDGGTNLQASLSLDLAPIIGPFAAFVPANEVAKMIGPDLEAALAAIAQRAEPKH